MKEEEVVRELEGVIVGGKSHACVHGDNLDVMRLLPDGCCSLTMTSPPYSAQRTYGIKYKLVGMTWVEWMIPRVIEMCRVTQGLVCINMSGPVKDHSYTPVVEWLVTDLTREHGLVCGPAPYVYFRFGIPGSGSKHYHRRDWEPVYCFARPECLPLAWSDNTALGHPPKWAPGGEMSNRLGDGTRVNQWGRTGGSESGGQRGRNGKRQRKSRPSHEEPQSAAERCDATPELFSESNDAPFLPIEGADDVAEMEQLKPTSKRLRKAKRITTGPNGEVVLKADKQFKQVVLANPGNVIREVYDAEIVRKLFDELVAGRIDQGDVIRCLTGGGNMGSPLAHENEAPFSTRLCEFFVRSFAPPGSIVLDPFSGSGTTLAVAIKEGRRGIGIDVRPDQVELTKRRLSGETGSLFGNA